MTWTVEMFPEEKAFIDKVFDMKLNTEDGYGDFIAPVRGGTIYLDDYRMLTEEQQKWLIFNRLQDPKYKHQGVLGIKFMNFTYVDPLPLVMEDPEAMDKWGVKRMTTDGQPVDPITGKPLERVRHQEKVETIYKWDAEAKVFTKGPSQTLLDYRFSETDSELPEKVLD